MRRWGWLVVGSLLSQASTVCAGEKPQQRSEQEIKALIDQLVSPNPKPITGDEDARQAPDYRLPPGFVREKQKQVHRARSKLTQLGPQAFPFLIERWGDKRYCLTTSHGLSGYCHNETVGHICRAIIFDQLQPYSYWPSTEDDPRGKPRRPDYPTKFLGSQKSARQWWDKNKQKTLYQMQR